MLNKNFRRPHILTPNKETVFPSRWVFFDTETFPEEYQLDDNEIIYVHKLKLGWAVYVEIDQQINVTRQEWFNFKKPEEFWNWLFPLVKPNKHLYVMSHNLHFDFAVVNLYDGLQAYNYKSTEWYINSQVFILKCVNNSGKYVKKITFLDSFNYFKTNLATLGKYIGLEKLEVDFNTVSENDLSAYCKRDVEILSTFMLKFYRFLKEFDVGNFKPTIASLSFTNFRHIEERADVWIHGDEKVCALERESYRGGRCECFRLGKFEGKFYKLDVNSMYPFIMKNNLFPVRLEKYFPNGLEVKEFLNVLKKFLVIARVDFEIDEPAIGIKHERLIFPVGKITAVLTNPEIEYILKNGVLYSIKECAIYEKGDIFSTFVDKWYSQRLKFKKEGNLIYSEFCKIILNSLYGKFGQLNNEWKKVNSDSDKNMPDGVEEILNIATGKREYYITIGGITYTNKGKSEPDNGFVAISSFVTSYARMYLWNLIKTAGINNVYYCDTDSLFVNEEGYNNLKVFINEKELGKLKVEEITGKLELYGLKDYVFGDKPKLKGIKKDAVRINDNCYEQFQFLKVRGQLRLGITNGAVVRKVVKKLNRDYKKGIVSNNGEIIPFDYEELEKEELYKINAKYEKEKLEEYEEWRKGDYYDYHEEDSLLTKHEKFEEWKQKWKDYI